MPSAASNVLSNAFALIAACCDSVSAPLLSTPANVLLNAVTVPVNGPIGVDDESTYGPYKVWLAPV